MAETDRMIRRLAEKDWAASRKELRLARTVVLKLKTREFQDYYPQSHARLSFLLVRGIDGHRPGAARPSGPEPTATLSACRRRVEHFREPEGLLRIRTFPIAPLKAAGQ